FIGVTLTNARDRQVRFGKHAENAIDLFKLAPRGIGPEFDGVISTHSGNRLPVCGAFDSSDHARVSFECREWFYVLGIHSISTLIRTEVPQLDGLIQPPA